MPKRPIPRSIDEYIAASSPEAQPLLKRIRKIVREAAPQAEETISYGMPALKQRGILVYFGAFKNHMAVPTRTRRYEAHVGRNTFCWRQGESSFSLGQPIPYGLIRRIVENRVLAQQSKPLASR